MTVYHRYNSKLSSLSPDEPLCILSPLIGTLWHEWFVSGRIEKHAMQKLVAEFAAKPEMLFWRGTASELIWSIYHFEKIGFSFSWGFMRNQSNQVLLIFLPIKKS